MPAFFCELLSEEIPARMQARAADDLARLMSEALAPLSPTALRVFWGPRRLALAAEIAGEAITPGSTERGPRLAAPEQAVAGFLRKHAAERQALRREGDFWVLEKPGSARPAAELIAKALPPLLRRFPWPKSMRWGGGSGLLWVRPLRRIACLFDGRPLSIALAVGDDDAHGLVTGGRSEGHRFLAPDEFAIESAAHWQDELRRRYVIADAAERESSITRQIADRAAAADVSILEDAGLVAEVAGLVEWPVALRGRIDERFMDLPPEVMQVSMRVNQRYFATRTQAGAAAPYFVFVANVEAPDGGAAIVAGNERVLRARFSDARHFWDLDRRTRLADRVAALEGVTFHARLGTQGARARRLERLAREIAKLIGVNDPELAARAALLAKADLTTGMVGEFPELQGVMGAYYAGHDHEPLAIINAIRDHYLPRGPDDPINSSEVTAAVALADKIDQLVAFFAIGEKPTGSGDPFALRRAALGILRLVFENQLRLLLRPVIEEAARAALMDVTQPGMADATAIVDQVIAFIAERMRILLRNKNIRADAIAMCLERERSWNLLAFLYRAQALSRFLDTPDGGNLLAAYKRAANILRIEDRKDGPHNAGADAALFQQAEERALWEALTQGGEAASLIAAEKFEAAMGELARLRAPLDAFFDKVMVNADAPALRLNRLRLLAQLRDAMNEVAAFGATGS